MDRDQNIKELKLELEKLGAENVKENLISEKMDIHKNGFLIRASKQFVTEEELEMVHAVFLIDHLANERYSLTEYEISRLKQINIDPKIAEKYGFDDLEERIGKFDWENLHPATLSKSDEVSLPMVKEIQRIFNELDYLKIIDDEAEELANQLEAKYILNTPFDVTLQNIKELNLKYQLQLKVEMGQDDEISMEQANNLFNGNAVFFKGIEDFPETKRAKDHWIEMNEEDKMQVIYPDPGFNLRDKIADLPIRQILGEVPIDEIAKSLEMGGAYLATYTGGFLEEKVRLFVDPSNSSVRLFYWDVLNEEVGKGFDIAASRISAYSENPFMPPEEIEKVEKNITDHAFTSRIIPILHELIRRNEKDFLFPFYGERDRIVYKAELKFHTDGVGKMSFQSYELAALRPHDLMPALVQSFPIDQGLNLRLPEALNLLHGRPVLLNMPGQNANENRIWMKMDFDRRDLNGDHPVMPMLEQGLVVHKALEDFHLPNLEYENIRKEVVKKLEYGDALNVAVITPKGTVHVVMEADPKINGFAFKAKDGSPVLASDLKDEQWIQFRKASSEKRNSGDDEEIKKGRRNKK